VAPVDLEVTETRIQLAVICEHWIAEHDVLSSKRVLILLLSVVDRDGGPVISRYTKITADRGTRSEAVAVFADIRANKENVTSIRVRGRLA
jgi:hypothetical protein